MTFIIIIIIIIIYEVVCMQNLTKSYTICTWKLYVKDKNKNDVSYFIENNETNGFYPL